VGEYLARRLGAELFTMIKMAVGSGSSDALLTQATTNTTAAGPRMSLGINRLPLLTAP